MANSIPLEDMSEYARNAVHTLDLEPHPEGGWYKQTWLSQQASQGTVDGEDKGRPLASLIYFLLAQGDASAWHKVDADEIWLWHGPATVTLELGGSGDAPDDDPKQITRVMLGQGLADADNARHGNTAAAPDQEPVGQYVIPKGYWQRTVPGTGDAIVSCVVSPGFSFDGFTLE